MRLLHAYSFFELPAHFTYKRRTYSDSNAYIAFTVGEACTVAVAVDMNNVHRVFRLYTKSVAANTQLTFNGNSGTPTADQYHILLSLDPASKVERMTYDAFNRMTQWTDGTDTEDHEYRHEKWVRVGLNDGTTETSFLYDGDNVLADLVDSSFVKQYRGYVPPDGGSVRN